MQAAVRALVLCILPCSHSKQLARGFFSADYESRICVLLERRPFQKPPLLSLVFCKCKHLVDFKAKEQRQEILFPALILALLKT